MDGYSGRRNKHLGSLNERVRRQVAGCNPVASSSSSGCTRIVSRCFRGLLTRPTVEGEKWLSGATWLHSCPLQRRDEIIKELLRNTERPKCEEFD